MQQIGICYIIHVVKSWLPVLVCLAAVAEYHRKASLGNRNLQSLSSQGQELEVEMLERMGSF